MYVSHNFGLVLFIETDRTISALMISDALKDTKANCVINVLHIQDVISFMEHAKNHGTASVKKVGVVCSAIKI